MPAQLPRCLSALCLSHCFNAPLCSRSNKGGCAPPRLRVPVLLLPSDIPSQAAALFCAGRFKGDASKWISPSLLMGVGRTESINHSKDYTNKVLPKDRLSDPIGRQSLPVYIAAIQKVILGI